MVCDIRITDGEAALKRSTVQINISYLDTLGNLGQSIELSKSVESSVFACICIIGLAEAVALHGVLRGVNGNADAVNSKILIIIAGGLLHMTLDGESIALLTGSQMSLGQIDSGIVDGPINNLIEFSIAPNTADDQLVLQGQIAVVDHTQLRQGIGAARLPQNLLARSSLDPVQCLALGGNPLASGILHFQRHIQVTGLNFVDAGRCGVGEPCEGSAYQHSQAQNHGHDAAQQGPFGTLAVCHRIFLLFFACASVADGFVGDAGNTDCHVGAAPLLRTPLPLEPPLSFQMKR